MNHPLGTARSRRGWVSNTDQLELTSAYSVEYTPTHPLFEGLSFGTELIRVQERWPSAETSMAGRRKTSTASKPSPDIFASTRRTATGRKPGRPPVHEEAWTKVTVVLFNRQIVFLDRLAASIRAQSGAAISRAQLIRALLDAVADADVDLTAAMSETDLKATILSRLGKYRLGS